MYSGLWGHKIMLAKIIASCEGTVTNSTLRLLCRRSGFTSEIYGRVIYASLENRVVTCMTCMLWL